MSLRPNAKVEVRRNRYKVAVDAEEGRRRREDNMVEIRKNRREESLQKKRREGLQGNQQFPIPVEATTGIDKKVYRFKTTLKLMICRRFKFYGFIFVIFFVIRLLELNG